MKVLISIIGVVFVFLLSLLKIERKKTSKERLAREKAEKERDELKVITTIQKQADQIKDDLVLLKEKNNRDKKEIEENLQEIPEDEKEELSDEVKKMAADQYFRAHARNNGVHNDRD